jgi:predicted acyl esterase
MPGGASGFEIRLGVSIPMSDGVSLNADLLLPTGAEPQPGSVRQGGVISQMA